MSCTHAAARNPSATLPQLPALSTPQLVTLYVLKQPPSRLPHASSPVRAHASRTPLPTTTPPRPTFTVDLQSTFYDREANYVTQCIRCMVQVKHAPRQYLRNNRQIQIWNGYHYINAHMGRHHFYLCVLPCSSSAYVEKVCANTLVDAPMRTRWLRTREANLARAILPCVTSARNLVCVTSFVSQISRLVGLLTNI